VTTDSALALMLGLFMTCARVGGPLLLIALAAGLVVGVAQAATQLNESSVSFVVKTAALVATLLLLGPTLAGFAVQYTRTSLQAIEHVVRG
jgi:flagellar biosynthetic protein FliQ